MLDGASGTPVAAVERWLAGFEAALAGGGGSALAALFVPDAHWRDLLALSWRVATVSGAGAIASALADDRRLAARAFEVTPGRTPPRRVSRAGTDTIEAIFRFRTATGTGEGVVQLLPGDAAAPAKAWTLLTALAALDDFPEAVGGARPSGSAYSRDFRGPNWLDRRRAAAAYADRDPDVLVVGAGQAGLSIAARLRMLGVDTLAVERNARVGDNWRHRYHALTLHNQVHVNHLPYMPFPPGWPTWIPKDMLAFWFEGYAEAMELNVWTDTGLAGAGYDAAAGRWTAMLRRADGTERRVRPRHIVMATGVSGIPARPAIAGLADFAGTVLHSGEWRDGTAWAGRRALVIGTGTSGHDIAQDLHAAGADVTMAQRSPTMVVNIEPSAQLPYALYEEGPDLADCDLLAAAMPLAPLREAHRLLTARAREIDRELLDGLERAGFRLDFGPDGTGWQFLYLTRGGGYYFNVGCSELIVDGKVGLVQFADINRIVADGARLRDGTLLPADLIVLATGFRGQEALVRKLFGEAVAERVGPIWGFDEARQELAAMWTRTGQPGLWFIAGSFAQCRIYSKVLALQIRAVEAGLILA
ncbi:MAG: NAD(P)/FAD-dependent oxidoreductase [Alphaproteobacteria bacterium]|nr:NAD(P)/FAD-dependent oxidoreductase [Alphaproteobacteria bacterium]